MSSAAIETSVPASRGVSERTGLAEAPKEPRRSERSAGKGRRRRAAAEQRRIEQQRWGQYLDDEDDTVLVPAPSGSRRRMRRASRRSSARDDLEDYLAGNLDSDYANSPHDNDATELDVALALSLSLADTAASGANLGASVLPDMSYESLVMLENVKCVASAGLVESLRVCAYTEKERPGDKQAEEVCAICQCDYENGDLLIKLPCVHTFHHGCGSEWLLNYSKLCPVCKHDVTE